MDSSDDELERAIQLSLQNDQDMKQRRQIDVVDLTEAEELWPGFKDLDEMELWKGIALSMGDEPSYEICQKYKLNSEKGEGTSKSNAHREAASAVVSGAQVVLSDTASEEEDTASEEDEKFPPKPAAINMTTSSSLGLKGLDRAQMERERLERLKRAPVQKSSEPPTKRAKIENFDGRSSVFSKTLSSNAALYPDGTIKWTYAAGYPVEPHHITIEQVLQKDTLKAAVLSGFQIDFPWVLSKIELSTTVVVFVAHSDSPEAHSQFGKDNKVQLLFPQLKSLGAFGVGCMHSKLQLLFHSDYLRVVVPTGNLVSYDWGETGIMENMMYIQDFPRDPSQQAPEKLPQFARDLLFFIKGQNLPSHILNKLCEYNFERSVGIEFVHSMSGDHLEELERHGKNGLASAINRLGVKPRQGETLQLCYVTSSLGNLNDAFLTEMYQSASGIQQEPTKRGPRERQKDITSKDIDRFKIFYPSEKTVRQSRGGAGSGGTICLQLSHWNNEAFPKQLIFDCVNTRKGLLMHNKVLCGRIVRARGNVSTGPAQTQKHPLVNAQQEVIDPDEREITKSWFYIGSANLSPSAWLYPRSQSRGNKVVIDRAKKKPKVIIRNWECGIVCSPEKLGFGLDAWNILKRFIIVDEALPVVQVGKPWILENGVI